MTKVSTALDRLDDAAARGVTYRELCLREQWSHASASRVLSDLHRAGTVARLDEQRDGCGVYVLVQHIDGRPTVPHGSTRVSLSDQALAQALTDTHVMADRVEKVIAAHQLDSSRFATIRQLAAEFRQAVGREQPDDDLAFDLEPLPRTWRGPGRGEHVG